MKHSSLMLLIVVLVTALPCRAQASESPGPTLEMFAGHAGFLDDSMIPHTVLGGSGRFYLTSRLGVGPEVGYSVTRSALGADPKARSRREGERECGLATECTAWSISESAGKPTIGLRAGLA